MRNLTEQIAKRGNKGLKTRKGAQARLDKLAKRLPDDKQDFVCEIAELPDGTFYPVVIISQTDWNVVGLAAVYNNIYTMCL